MNAADTAHLTLALSLFLRRVSTGVSLFPPQSRPSSPAPQPVSQRSRSVRTQKRHKPRADAIPILLIDFHRFSLIVLDRVNSLSIVQM